MTCEKQIINYPEFTYKDITVTFCNTFEDNKEYSYACFVEALAYEMEKLEYYDKININIYNESEKKLINDKIKLKNNGISRLLKYFNKEDFWYMDILYATAIANDQEKILYKEILDEICKNILDSDLLDLIQIDYINTLYDIINGTNKDIEQYLHNYTSVDIPNIVNGKIKPLI